MLKKIKKLFIKDLKKLGLYERLEGDGYSTANYKVINYHYNRVFFFFVVFDVYSAEVVPFDNEENKYDYSLKKTIKFDLQTYKKINNNDIIKIKRKENGDNDYYQVKIVESESVIDNAIIVEKNNEYSKLKMKLSYQDTFVTINVTDDYFSANKVNDVIKVLCKGNDLVPYDMYSEHWIVDNWKDLTKLPK